MKSPATIGIGPIVMTKLQTANSETGGSVVDITAKTENFNMYFKMDSGKLGPSTNKMISPEFPKSLGVIVGPGGSAESVTFYNDSGPARSNA